MTGVREPDGIRRVTAVVSFYGSALVCGAIVSVSILLLFQAAGSYGRLEATVQLQQATIDQQQQVIDELRAKLK